MNKLILMPEKNAPLVHIELALMNGSLRDPGGKAGTASLMLSMLLRGTQKHSAEKFHEILDGMGAEIHLGKYRESLRIHGVVLKESLTPFLDLIDEMVNSPAFSPEEFAKIKNQFRSSMIDELGSDDDIADRRFQEYMLWGNPYGRMTSGGLETIDQITLEDLKKFHADYFRASDFVVGATGGFEKADLKKKLSAIFKKMPAKGPGRMQIEAPTWKKERNMLLLDKPERSQAQVLVGSVGVAFDDKDYFPMLIANHVFGGSSFSARLMKEVREKRGWSYGAYSWYRAGRKPLYFGMQSVPSNKDAVPAMKLMIELLEQYGKKGVTKDEFQFAKGSLVSQGAFLQDTMRKRLDNKVTEAVMGLKEGYFDHYQGKLKKVSHSHVQAAIKRKVKPDQLFALVLTTISSIEADLKTLRGFKNVWRHNFQDAPQGLWGAEVGKSPNKSTPKIIQKKKKARKAVSRIAIKKRKSK